MNKNTLPDIPEINDREIRESLQSLVSASELFLRLFVASYTLKEEERNAMIVYHFYEVVRAEFVIRRWYKALMKKN